MNRTRTVVLVVVVLVLLGVGGFFGFRAFEEHEAQQKAGMACGTLDTRSAGAVLPPVVALPEGQKLLSVETQGKTVIVRTSAAGGLDDVEKVRDDALAALVAQGFTRGSTEAEAGIEAEGEFGGKADGSLKVRALCQGRLELRYSLRL